MDDKVEALLKQLEESMMSSSLAVADHLRTVASNDPDNYTAEDMADEADELAAAATALAARLRELRGVTCDCKRANGPRAVCHCDGKGGWS